MFLIPCLAELHEMPLRHFRLDLVFAQPAPPFPFEVIRIPSRRDLPDAVIDIRIQMADPQGRGEGLGPPALSPGCGR